MRRAGLLPFIIVLIACGAGPLNAQCNTIFLVEGGTWQGSGGHFTQGFRISSSSTFVLRFASEYQADAAIVTPSELSNFQNNRPFRGFAVLDNQFGTRSVTLAPGTYYLGARNQISGRNRWRVELDKDLSFPGYRRIDSYSQTRLVSPNGGKLEQPFTIRQGVRTFIDGANVDLETFLIPDSEIASFMAGGTFRYYEDYSGSGDDQPGCYEVTLPPGRYHLAFRNSNSNAKPVVYTIEEFVSTSGNSPPPSPPTPPPPPPPPTPPPPPPSPAGRPANDSFAAAIVISGAQGSITGVNTGATAESGEPAVSQPNSVWWRWTAPASGPVTFGTSGSSFDTKLAAFTGSTVAGLTLIVQNDDGPQDLTSLIQFNASAGSAYSLAVSGYDGAAGNIVLRWTLTAAGTTPPTPPTQPPPPSGGSSRIPVTVPDRGGQLFQFSGTSQSVGYSRMSGAGLPAGFAIIQFSNNGVVVSETSIPGTAPSTSGITFVEVNGPTNAGVAIANPSSQTATISFAVEDSFSGNLVSSGSLTLGPNQQTAAFLDQSPFNARSVIGTFRYTSNVAVAVTALRGHTNSRSDFLVSTLPMADSSAPPSAPIHIPHVADGNGWKSFVVLINPTDQVITGRNDWYTNAGDPLLVQLEGHCQGCSPSSSYDYRIGPRSALYVPTAGTGSTLRTGQIRITPDGGHAAPVAFAIFRFTRGGVVVSEASVNATPLARRFRTYVEADRSNSVESGVTLTAGPNGARVSLMLTDLMGRTARSAQVTIPPFGQFARFLSQIPGLGDLGPDVVGVLHIDSAEGVSAAGMLSRVNQRGDFLMSTTPPAEESEFNQRNRTAVVFPQVVVGGAYRTRIALFSGASGNAFDGSIDLVRQDGSAWPFVSGLDSPNLKGARMVATVRDP